MEYQPLLAVAIDAARAAGERLRRDFHAPGGPRGSGEKAPVDTRTANPGTAHMAFFTDDCEGLYADLTAKGVRSVSPPVTPTIGPNTGGRAVYMIDPDGIRVEFIQTARSFGQFSQADADATKDKH